MSDDVTSASGLDAIGSLAEPNRRTLYEFVVAAGDWVTRDEAAAAAGLERGTAAHHLDRLAADGLLDVVFRRTSGRTGPGAGRPSKLYRRAAREFELSLPPRDYELAGKLLARAVDRARRDGTPVGDAVVAEAEAEGERLGEAIRAGLQGASAQRSAARRGAVLEALSDHGFEPHFDGDTIVLRNCPFHRLAEEHTELVCGMNLCVLRAVIDRVGRTGLRAELEPEVGLCCVRLHLR